MILSNNMKNKCLSCGHQWFQRTDAKPLMCPKCKTYKWNQKKGGKKEDDNNN